jgi:hypothetical protein
LSKGPRRISDDSHLKILDEIKRRDILDCKEDDGSSSGDDSIEPSGEESSNNSSDDGSVLE